MFCLTLLTTAYLGLAAALLLVGFAAGGLLRRSVSPQAWAAAAVVAVPVCALYAVTFAAGGAEAAAAEVSWRVSTLDRSAHLLALAGPSASQDRFAHSASATTPAVVLCLALVAPVALRGAAGWRVAAAPLGYGCVSVSSFSFMFQHFKHDFPLPMSQLSDGVRVAVT